MALSNCGEKRAAAKHFAQLEANIQNMKEREMDAEVNYAPVLSLATSTIIGSRIKSTIGATATSGGRTCKETSQ